MIPTEKRRIILDTDAGIDDAVAIVVLLKSCREQLKLVLTSYGNITLENAVLNALSVLALAGADDIPVICGADKPGPGNGAYENAAHIHGADGLGGLRNKAPLNELKLKKAVKGDYLQIIYDAIIEEQAKVDYIAIGPLTNLSALIKRFPDVLDYLDKVTVMGGGIKTGNITPYAEFNFYCDAESANHVLATIPDLTLVTLNLTNKIVFDLPGIAEIGAAGTDMAKFIESVLVYNYRQCVAYGDSGSVMHDAAAVLAYVYPELFEFELCEIKVESGQERYGESILINKKNKNNIKLAVKTDIKLLLKIITDSIII